MNFHPLSILFGALGGLARCFFRYIEKKSEGKTAQFDSGLAFWSLIRGVLGGALLGFYIDRPDMALFTGLSTDLVLKNIIDFIRAQLK